MRLKSVLLSIFCLQALFILGQKKGEDPVIFCYGKNKVYQSELERGYLRNKDLSKNKPTVADIEEYLKLYQNFKLKVQDAKDRKMDTLPEYIKELADYRRQLAKKYLSDSAMTEELTREAYDRMKYMVNASHILILSSYGDSPADTLVAYNKLQDILNKINKNEVSFQQAAISFSEDPSAKREGSLGYKGDLGWFSAFQMLYEFESMAFTTPVGSVSEIFRTRFGYHIVKTNDKKESKGERRISQIVIRRLPNETKEDSIKASQRIQAVHKLLVNGAGWDTTLLKYTEEQNARYNNGIVDWFAETTDKVPQEVVDESFSMSVKGQISQPIASKYAWHIVMLMDNRPFPSYAEKEVEIRNKVSQDSRIYKSTEATIERIKKQSNFKENAEVLNTFIQNAETDFMNSAWSTSSLKNPDAILFTLGSTNFKISSFSDFVVANQNFQQKPKSGAALLNSYYKSYLDNTVMTYEDEHLETKYPEFGLIYQDFKDGILFFNINSIEVWNKPMTDTTGLRNYYNNHRDSFNWKERVVALSISAASHDVMHQAERMIKNGENKDSVMNRLNNNNPLNVYIERGVYQMGMNANADALLAKKADWANNGTPYFMELPNQNGVYKGIVAIELLPSAPKSFEESRGQASSLFQNQEEQKWLSGLKSKYKIKVKKKAYEAFKQKMLGL